jgi:nucleolar protein 9
MPPFKVMPLTCSLLAQDVSLLLEYASSPVASHFLDAVLSSPAVSPKYRRKLLSAFMGHYRELAEDRMGSRVADTIWAKADGFMKVSLSAPRLAGYIS